MHVCMYVFMYVWTGKRANRAMFDKTGKELQGGVLLDTVNVIRWLVTHER